MTGPTSRFRHADHEAALARACERVAPLWPLDRFVAVNPFRGLDDLSQAAAATRLARVAGARSTMPRGFYAAAITDGQITEADLAEALAQAPRVNGLPRDVAELRTAVLRAAPETVDERLPTVTDVAGRLADHDWSGFAQSRIADWAAAHFDRRQAAWRAPWQEDGLWAAWQSEAVIDRGPELAGLAGFRRTIAALPNAAAAARRQILQALGVPPAGGELYAHRLLMTIAGWAGHVRWLDWEDELRQRDGRRLRELATIRLAWEFGVYRAGQEDLAEAWRMARSEFVYEAQPGRGEVDRHVDLLLHDAFERAWQRRFFARLQRPLPTSSATDERPLVQAAFCIDVRSEVFRRSLETVEPRAATIGCAGFFGMPIEFVPVGQTEGVGHCPALIAPTHVVGEGLSTEGPSDMQIGTRRLSRRRARRAWKNFKQAAVTSFAFVETMGLGFAGKLASDSFGWSRPTARPGKDAVDRRLRAALAPDPRLGSCGHRQVGLSFDDQVSLATGLLTSLSLGRQPARLILLAGHASSTVNNPHAAGLDCGACGGQSGEANARLAARLLNDPAVRAALAAGGQTLPADTVFVAGLHDTTTDALCLFDTAALPASHATDLAHLQDCLVAAGRLTRSERALRFRLSESDDIDAALVGRSRDWSQVRPEWGLAGCGAFLIAPRRHSVGRDLGGQCFLHSYDWQADTGFALLEQIMTAPMVVTSWINLQYYAATVDHRHFGAGDKVLHNIVAGLGVVEGNGGDLRPGLPWQSLHDGERLMHEPVRLSVIIEAPTAAIQAVIDRHPPLARLLDHGWLHLFVMNDAGQVAERYAGHGTWLPVAAIDGRITDEAAELVA